jgi:hypothetical protein
MADLKCSEWSREVWVARSSGQPGHFCTTAAFGLAPAVAVIISA